MPKSTFNNLSVERQQEILNACRAEFTELSFEKASVAGIISRLNIARGTFYKYFENLEACYFYLLSKETIEMHKLFMNAMEANNYDLSASLEDFGERIAHELYQKKTYGLYRSRYLSWTPLMQENWQAYGSLFSIPQTGFSISPETLHCIKAVVHSLIQRLFIEDWSRQVFLEKYQEHINIIISGLGSLDTNKE